MDSLVCNEIGELEQMAEVNDVLTTTFKDLSVEKCDLAEGEVVVCEDMEYQRSNNAKSTPRDESVFDIRSTEQSTDSSISTEYRETETQATEPKETEPQNLHGQVNAAFENESDVDDGSCQAQSNDDPLENKQMEKLQEAIGDMENSPSTSETAAKDNPEISQQLNDNKEAEIGDQTKLGYAGSSCTESPGMASQDGDDEESIEYKESAGGERVASIEAEYIERIAALEQRHYELEDVLARLTSSLEDSLCAQMCDDAIPNENSTEEPRDQETENEVAATITNRSKAVSEKEKQRRAEARKLGIDLFVEFQQKIRYFAADVNGVLNCSEAAIRHARVVQEWATSVQMMFEQIKDERQKILVYIDERERNMMVAKEQFIAELQEQGKELRQLVDEMKSYRELRDKVEERGITKVEECVEQRSVDENIIDMLLKKRFEDEKSLILSLRKQSKISEMKLFIIHQQSCIQQLQEQNKELKAIIEGLMGPEDIEEEDPFDTDQSGTPASETTQDRCPIRDSLGKIDDPPLSLVSDVMYCDRADYLPGVSTDGDVATIQAYDLGVNADKIDNGNTVVFDPLDVSYVREQCKRAEESERQAHAASNVDVEDVTRVQSSRESENDIDDVPNVHVSLESEHGIQMLQDGVQVMNVEPYLRKCMEKDQTYEVITEELDAAGDGTEVPIQKTVRTSPDKDVHTSGISGNTDVGSEATPDGVISDLPRPISPV